MLKHSRMIVACGLGTCCVIVVCITKYSAGVNKTHGSLLSSTVNKIHDYMYNDTKANQIQNIGLADDADTTLKREDLHRKLEKNVYDLWNYLGYHLTHLNDSDPQLRTTLDRVKKEAGERQRVVLHDIKDLRLLVELEGRKSKEARGLSDIVQARLRFLQNPDDCTKARKIICSINYKCGFGCHVHHIMRCLIMAYATKRTLVLKSNTWPYSKEGFEKAFLPLSETCIDSQGISFSAWTNQLHNDSTQVLIMKDLKMPELEYLPPSVPGDLVSRLQRFHGIPSLWWIGQTIKYVFRPQPWLEMDLALAYKNIGFRKPIVGVHVRRTDKLRKEAKFHDIAEYMAHVDDYFDTLELRQRNITRQIYLATDEPELLNEIRSKYRNYKIISNHEFSISAAPRKRYTEKSLRGIIMDIHFLSLTDYIVCTFSSNVCRAAYELMQTLHTDASMYFYSLDAQYFFHGQGLQKQRAIFNHKRQDEKEIDLAFGDVIHSSPLRVNLNGFSYGLNTRTNSSGVYPSYKVITIIDHFKSPHIK